MKKTLIALLLILSTYNVLAQSFDEDLQRPFRYDKKLKILPNFCKNCQLDSPHRKVIVKLINLV
ncbi:MAG: hypothetical protein RL607_694 [Bacteroidota bacterium]|jgi:hypothetical protein